MVSKCLYSGDKHILIENEEGGFLYCAECGEIIKVTDIEKYNIWFHEESEEDE